MNGLPPNIHGFDVGPMMANCYIFVDPSSSSAAVIDPGGDGEKIAEFIDQKQLQPVVVIDTHSHIDHIAANRFLIERYRVPLAIHSLDAPGLLDPSLNLGFLAPMPVESPPADKILEDGDAILVGDSSLTVISTPGHTAGGICLLYQNSSGPDVVFSGDTLFAGSIGRTDFPGGSLHRLLDSVRTRIFVLAPDTLVLPGHGPATTVGREMVSNPFL